MSLGETSVHSMSLFCSTRSLHRNNSWLELVNTCLIFHFTFLLSVTLSQWPKVNSRLCCAKHCSVVLACANPITFYTCMSFSLIPHELKLQTVCLFHTVLSRRTPVKAAPAGPPTLLLLRRREAAPTATPPVDRPLPTNPLLLLPRHPPPPPPHSRGETPPPLLQPPARRPPHRGSCTGSRASRPSPAPSHLRRPTAATQTCGDTALFRVYATPS